MRTDTQNPNADIIIYHQPPLLVRYGIIFIVFLVLIFYFIGNKITIPVKERLEVNMGIEQSNKDTVICYFHIDRTYVNNLRELSSIDIVLNNEKYVIKNVQYKLFRDDNDHYTIAVFINDKSNVQKINTIIDNTMCPCYVVMNGDQESLSDYVMKSFLSLFTED